MFDISPLISRRSPLTVCPLPLSTYFSLLPFYLSHIFQHVPSETGPHLSRTVLVYHSPLHHTGGSARTVGSSSRLELDAGSMTFDPDNPDEPITQFSWDCAPLFITPGESLSSGEVSVDACTDKTGRPLNMIIFKNQRNITFYANYFSVNTMLRFTVVANQGERKASASTSIKILPGNAGYCTYYNAQTASFLSLLTWCTTTRMSSHVVSN